MTTAAPLPKSIRSQLVHWTLAIERLTDLGEVAAPEAWASLERQANTALRSSLRKSLNRLGRRADRIALTVEQFSPEEPSEQVHSLRRDYLRTEAMLDFFADAINSRSSPKTAVLLAALDSLAAESMRRVLAPLGYSVPPVITFMDRGLGAAILKFSLRLHDRHSLNPVAAIKVVRHNALTSTATLHETGHQIAHTIGWNEELARALSNEFPGAVGDTWASWATEVAADAFAFVHAGFASTSALRNVVDGGRQQVFRYIEGDPHPIGFLRVLLGAEMARQCFGEHGPWIELARSWEKSYPIAMADGPVQRLIGESMTKLTLITQLVLAARYRSFGGKALREVIDPSRVSPVALDRFEREAGPRAFTSHYVVHREPIRLLALSGLRIATDPDRARDYYEKQAAALRVLGEEAIAA